MMSSVRRARDERGVTIVEAAFVLPILFLFVFTLIDIGLLEFEQSQATSGARDGARAGILRPTAGTTSGGAIDNAVKARMPGRSYTLTVACQSSSGGSKACASTLEGDRIKVDVYWDRPSLSYAGRMFLGNSRQVRGAATMTIVGSPAP